VEVAGEALRSGFCRRLMSSGIELAKAVLPSWLSVEWLMRFLAVLWMSSIDVGWLKPIEGRANEFISVASVAVWMAVSNGGTANGEQI
jgi:hypothetical protein